MFEPSDEDPRLRPEDPVVSILLTVDAKTFDLHLRQHQKAQTDYERHLAEWEKDPQGKAPRAPFLWPVKLDRSLTS